MTNNEYKDKRMITRGKFLDLAKETEKIYETQQ